MLAARGVTDLLGGDFKNKRTTKQLFEQEYNCSNFLDFKTFILRFNWQQFYNQQFYCFTLRRFTIFFS